MGFERMRSVGCSHSVVTDSRGTLLFLSGKQLVYLHSWSVCLLRYKRCCCFVFPNRAYLDITFQVNLANLCLPSSVPVGGVGAGCLVFPQQLYFLGYKKAPVFSPFKAHSAPGQKHEEHVSYLLPK